MSNLKILFVFGGILLVALLVVKMGLVGHKGKESVEIQDIGVSKGDELLGVGAYVLTPEEEKVLVSKAKIRDGSSAYRLYLYYEFVKLDSQKSIEWLRKSAEYGHPQGQYNFGIRYLQEASLYDRKKAKYWLELSAKNGFKEAIEVLRKEGLDD